MVKIADLQQKIANLEEKLAAYEEVIANMPGHIYWKDREGRYLGCNYNQAKDLHFENIAEVVGKKDADFTHIFSKAKTRIFRSNDLRIMQSGQAEIMEEPAYMDEKRVVVLSHKSPLYNKKGMIIGIIGISLDITQRKILEHRLEKAVKKHEITITNILSNLPGHVYWKNKKGIYLGCNDKQAESSGFKRPEELLGKTDFNCQSPDIAEKIRANDCEIIERGIPQIFEESVFINNRKFTMLSHKSPFKDQNGKIIGILGISLDVSKLKEKERELKELNEQIRFAHETKNRFIINISHDLRTPITGIINLCKNLVREIKTAEEQKKIKYLVSANYELLNLLNGILQLTQTESGSLPIWKKKFSLRETMTKIVHLMKPVIEAKNLHLELKYDPQIPEFLLGDKMRMHRIILNLMSNAIKFTANGMIALRVYLSYKNDRNVILKIEIADTGIGIPLDKQQIIFASFDRLKPSHKSIYQGHGLGLPIVKQFVKELDGEIEIDSELDKGSTFTLIIPFTEPILQNDLSDKSCLVDFKMSKKPVYIKPKFELPKKGSLLVVEDNKLVRMVVVDQFKDYNLDISAVTCGLEAIEKFKQQSFDLIIMDLGLPDIDGVDVTKEIRKIEKKDQRIRATIIALTAHLNEDSKDEIIASGMDGFYIKPLDDISLLNVLNTLVLQHRVQSYY